MNPIDHSDPKVEHRREIRFRLGGSVVFSWEGLDGKRFQGNGSSRDISVAGAYIHTSTCPPVDASVRVDVLLPLVDPTAPTLVIHAEARVLRVEHPAGGIGRSGFAVESRIRDGGGFGLMSYKKKNK